MSQRRQSARHAWTTSRTSYTTVCALSTRLSAGRPTLADEFAGTPRFVNEVFEVIKQKSFAPGYVPPQPSQPKSPAFNPPTGPAALVSQSHGLSGPQNGAVNGAGGQSRKRGREGSEGPDGRDPHYRRGSGERAMKQMRRGGGRGGAPPTGPAAGRGGGMGGGRDAAMGGAQVPQMSGMPGMPGMPTPPLGFPAFDPSNPLAAIMAMQAMGMPPLPGFPGMPMMGSPTGFGQGGQPGGENIPPKKVGERCKDYDTKGFCSLGAICPYEHGTDHITVPRQEGKSEMPPRKMREADLCRVRPLESLIEEGWRRICQRTFREKTRGGSGARKGTRARRQRARRSQPRAFLDGRSQ